jgi:hypothetical protein
VGIYVYMYVCASKFVSALQKTEWTLYLKTAQEKPGPHWYAKNKKEVEREEEEEN